MDHGLGTAPPGSVNRYLAYPVEEQLGEEALDTPAGEVITLREVGQPAIENNGQEKRVGERKVVAGEQRRARIRHILPAFHPRPKKHAQPRANHPVLKYPVEHPDLLDHANP